MIFIHLLEIEEIRCLTWFFVERMFQSYLFILVKEDRKSVACQRRFSQPAINLTDNWVWPNFIFW